MAWVLNYMSLGEFTKLVVCLSLDMVEYIVPILLVDSPVNYIFHIFSLICALYLFGWTGLISALDLVPGLDILPMNTITWMVWFTRKHPIGATVREI